VHGGITQRVNEDIGTLRSGAVKRVMETRGMEKIACELDSIPLAPILCTYKEYMAWDFRE
jgi:hypothetical protein